MDSGENLSFESIPVDSTLINIYFTAFFCFLCQVTFALLLALNFRTQKEFYVLSWPMQAARFICAILIHF